MIRLGLCCIFLEQPIRFRQATATSLLKLDKTERLALLSAICLDNLHSLLQALQWVEGQGIGAFRILSPLFPRYTHPRAGYRLEDLPGYDAIMSLGQTIRRFRQEHDIRLSLHPDQFNVLSSPDPWVLDGTIRELEYQGLLAELLDIEVINLHAGGVYGNKSDALARLHCAFGRLSPVVASRLALENDDRGYSPADLLPVCAELGIPMVYDVHHHRCLPDSCSIDQATEGCLASWHALGREPYLHLSSPRFGWSSSKPRCHADYIDPDDFPSSWESLTATVDVEAKAKELAVLRLRDDLANRGVHSRI